MKKYIFPILVATILLAGSIQTAVAQDIAFVNSAAILSELPAVKQAEEEMKTLEANMQARGKDMVAAFQKYYEETAGKAQRGELSPVQQQEAEKELQKKQGDIQKYEQDMVTQLQEKREGLLKPIYDRVNNAINDVAKEKGLKMVVEQGVLLYGETTLDITAQVKTKLGI
ncbi:OmpH family outer membrane protein [Aureitalea sp. L0-47]|uniref:OmpH family outer membrane protein n=1 Tax=Aureitalea sp. L0-47 TaxID=2816962 RepID=UPI0022377175|nr:OmpH family outer membrane protein [Aureitalea sp. L0-47]MCW5521128.1 OmpH family outer membrane protein [Aureitalea sp. L0-47]